MICFISGEICAAQSFHLYLVAIDTVLNLSPLQYLANGALGNERLRKTQRTHLNSVFNFLPTLFQYSRLILFKK